MEHKTEGITKTQIAVLSIGAGICVANIYYSQPILSAIAKDMHLLEKQVGNLPVLSQLGYGLGLLLLTPLGDKIERRKLTVILQILLIAALGAISVIHSLAGLYALTHIAANRC